MREGGRVDEGNERGRDGMRYGRREGKGREEASGGEIERGREEGKQGNFKGGILRRALAIHKPSHNAALTLETLVLQMKNSEQVNIINSVLRCVMMFCLTGR